MWINIVEPDRPQMTVLHMHFVYQITKAANTHLEYVIFSAFFTATVVAVKKYYVIGTYLVLFLLLIVVYFKWVPRHDSLASHYIEDGGDSLVTWKADLQRAVVDS